MSYQHIRDEHPTARKEHSCDLCGLAISVRTSHVKRTGSYDGRMDVFRMHIACEMVTRNWGVNEWENPGSEEEFREEKARFFAKQQEPRKESA